MRLHTNLYSQDLRNALRRAQDKGLITRDVDFTVFAPHRSRTHPHGFEIQLGTWYQDSLPDGYEDQNGYRMRVRRTRTSSHGDARYAATWHEWGWLIAEIFAADPGARWGANPAKAQNAYGYASPEDFHAKTDSQFDTRPVTEAEVHPVLAYMRDHVLHIPTA